MTDAPETGDRVRYSDAGPCPKLHGVHGTVAGRCPRAGWILVRFDSALDVTKCDALFLDLLARA